MDRRGGAKESEADREVWAMILIFSSVGGLILKRRERRAPLRAWMARPSFAKCFGDHRLPLQESILLLVIVREPISFVLGI
ncbi:MAG: hypothetical protein JWQ71_2844 [Pedosphaera sp.]|nr:hypothetical protein [Pedosphaera sp.]